MDSQGFKQLILPLQPSMQAMATSIMGQPDYASDAVQETVIALWQKRSHLEQVDNLEAYCIGILKHKCYDILRQEQHSLPLDPEMHQHEESSTEIEEHYQLAIKMVAQLPE